MAHRAGQLSIDWAVETDILRRITLGSSDLSSVSVISPSLRAQAARPTNSPSTDATEEDSAGGSGWEAITVIGSSLPQPATRPRRSAPIEGGATASAAPWSRPGGSAPSPVSETKSTALSGESRRSGSDDSYRILPIRRG